MEKNMEDRLYVNSSKKFERKGGIYLTYGIFTKEIESCVNKIEDGLGIKLVKSDLPNDDEIYYLGKSNNGYPTHLCIMNGSTYGYHLTKDQILYPQYLISCTIIMDINNDFDIVKKIQKKLKSIEYISELDYDIDEWEVEAKI